MSSAYTWQSRQHLGHVALDDAPRQAFGDGGLAHPGLAHQQRIVLAAAAQHLDHALELVLAADQRIDLADQCLGVQVEGVVLERAMAGLLVLLLFALLRSCLPWVCGVLVMPCAMKLTTSSRVMPC